MRALGLRVARARQLDAHAEHVLHVRCRGRERRDDRGAVVPERPVGVEPAAQLALLAACERGDALRLVGVALDERERLEHRVVDARGDVGALLAADPRARSASRSSASRQSQRPGDEEEPAGDGARREERRGRIPAAGQQDDGADPDERVARVRERRVGSESPAAAPRDGEARRDERDPRDGALGETDRVQKQGAGERTTPRPASHTGRPSA